MSAYYNEINPWCVAQLRKLIAKGWIADGEVDSRSIVDVRADDLRGFAQCHFFAGIGGWSLALRRAGWSDGRPVWTGSCPCGPFSNAGEMERFADERHLWPNWVHLIREREPAVVFGEQVASATEWLRLVRSDLEALGYAMGAAPIEAASAGAYHLRDRFWFVADRDGDVSECAGEGRGRGRGSSKARDDAGWGGDLGDASGSGAGRYGREISGAEAGGKGAGGLAGGVGDGAVHADTGGVAVVDGIGAGLEGYAWHGDRGAGREDEAGSIAAAGSDGSVMADGAGSGWNGRAAVEGRGQERGTIAGRDGGGNGEIVWYIGPDGKIRPAQSGIRLVADGVSDRVDKLTALGNAIDPRPAAEFIGAYMDIAK